MVVGSRLVISAALRNVSVPPGCAGWADADVGADVTFVIPPRGPLRTAPDVVVPVVFLAPVVLLAGAAALCAAVLVVLAATADCSGATLDGVSSTVVEDVEPGVLASAFDCF